MKKIVMACGLFVLGALAFGCSSQSKCEKAGADIESKYTSCSIEIQDPTEETGTAPECTEALGKQSECVAKCTTDASCETLKGEDAEGAVAYAECLGGC
jgi:hypothetical protein